MVFPVVWLQLPVSAQRLAGHKHEVLESDNFNFTSSSSGVYTTWHQKEDDTLRWPRGVLAEESHGRSLQHPPPPSPDPSQHTMAKVASDRQGVFVPLTQSAAARRCRHLSAESRTMSRESSAVIAPQGTERSRRAPFW
uniref:Uncharacterized protein n=1 Tax=Timema monikensis TaxID=170555 RepID=A0A7R9E5M1_9NEOP|nr:unnamed protein product [Timema monikensis]